LAMSLNGTERRGQGSARAEPSRRA
jgi:hypothetical protein